jgi:hypothetical protein
VEAVLDLLGLQSAVEQLQGFSSMLVCFRGPTSCKVFQMLAAERQYRMKHQTGAPGCLALTAEWVD